MSRNKRLVRGLVVAGFCGLAVRGVLELAYVNWHRAASPFESVPLLIRIDAKGDGRFEAPRSGQRRHRGIDLEAPVGTPVRAIRSGRVQTVAWHQGFGQYVELRHGAALTSLYEHLEAVVVSEGDRVRQGQIIGTVGKTGNARYRLIKPHLHLEVAQNGAPVDPGALGLVAAIPPELAVTHDAEGGE